MSQVEQEIHRKDYKSPGVVVDSLDLCFDLQDEFAIVTSQIIIKNLDPSSPIFLHGEQLELEHLVKDGAILNEGEYTLTELGLEIPDVGDTCKLEIVTKIYPQNNTQLSGLYRSHTMFCTQCEAEGFRRITYFFDRPDVLTVFTTKIIADRTKYPVLLSNGNMMDKGDLDNNRHWATWHDPFKKPSYLFALVAGDLMKVSDTFTTMSDKDVALEVFVEAGNETKCAHAIESLKKAMAWDEQVYGREYDLDIYMIVAVSDFNMGAMENKGLNIFNTKYVLADPQSATDDDYEGVESVIAHEYFHNWTGNRVTCRDWFQLSLKEGLTVFRDQEFSRDLNSRDVNRIKDVNILRAHQFAEDAGPMAHPVRPDSYIEINNFYTATIYNKGAEVIRMQHTLLGEKGFRKGMDLYFSRFDGQAVTIDDFVAAMEDANDINLSQLKRWYSQAGTPEVRAKMNFEPEGLALSLSQYCKPTPGQDEKLPFYIPIAIAIFDAEGNQQSLEKDIIVLKEEKETFFFKGIEKGAVVSLLRGFSAPVRMYITQDDKALKVLISHETDGFARVEAMQQLQKRHISELLLEEDMNSLGDKVSCISELFKTIIQQTDVDDALKAELLLPLGFETIVGDMQAIDVQRVMTVRKDYLDGVAEQCQNWMVEAYQSLHQKSHSANTEPSIYGTRKLKNILLGYLSKTKRHHDLIASQFSEAQNMSDELASFKLMLNTQTSQQQAIEQFYDKWHQDELVMDKWFAIQAMAEEPGVLSRVKSLMAHKDFDMKNPNKLRSLVGSFAMANPLYFHTDEGYEFLTDVLIEMDKVNPQTTARLLTPLTRWQRYCPSLQEKMKAQLQRLFTQKSLSKDVYEVVAKSL